MGHRSMTIGNRWNSVGGWLVVDGCNKCTFTYIDYGFRLHLEVGIVKNRVNSLRWLKTLQLRVSPDFHTPKIMELEITAK